MKKNTAKGHVSNNNDPGIVKVRLMGTAPDIENYSKELESSSSEWKISSQSDLLNLANSSKYKRKYIEVKKKNDSQEVN